VLETTSIGVVFGPLSLLNQHYTPDILKLHFPISAQRCQIITVGYMAAISAIATNVMNFSPAITT
jgi:hypothetical protein